MIQSIIFDVGGVLLRTEDRSHRQRLDTRFGLPPGQAEWLFFNSPQGRRAQVGEITTEQLWAWVGDELRLDAAGLRQFQEEFWAGDHMDYAMVDWIRQLKKRYQTAIISNAQDNLHTWLSVQYPIADAFELIVGSAYEGIMKPDAVIFQRTLQRLGRQPHEAIFIDDFPHNIEGARAVGMHAIHFTPGIDLVAELAKFGIIV